MVALVGSASKSIDADPSRLNKAMSLSLLLVISHPALDRCHQHLTVAFRK
jgi:hypothetical protein